MKLATTLIATATALLTLSSCGTSKSSQSTTTTTVLASTVTNAGNKVVTSCQKSSGTDMSVNISAVKNSSGVINNSLVKIKFNRLSTLATESGNTIRFFKWKVSNSQAYMDQIPLTVTGYNLSSGEANQAASQSITASQVTAAQGFYIDLNDEAGVYQVLKAVVYNSSGSIVTQQNILIPQFLGVASDYAYNADGSPRAQILRDLHPLALVDTTGWTSTNYTSYYQATCF